MRRTPIAVCLRLLNVGVNAAGGLIPASKDNASDIDTPIEYMLDDAKAEATRLIAADGTNCRNTIVVLVVGGAQGNTVVGANPATKASMFLSISSRRVPIYVIAIAPRAADVAQLTSIATNSGGQYFEITKAMIDAAPAGTPVPELVKAANIAISHGFMDYVDCNGRPRRRCRTGRRPSFRSPAPSSARSISKV